jgi:Zn-dependent protease
VTVQWQSVVWFILLIPSITFHEFMHGFAAYRLGDPTAKNAGRLTMNPLASIDPFGTVLLPLIGLISGGPIFGYAKPVPYNPMYFKNIRQGEIIVGLAGPSANLVLALFGTALAWAANLAVPLGSTVAAILYIIGYELTLANLVLMFFNLIPVPPLDGSSIVPLFLPDRALRGWYGLQRYAFVILIGLIFLLPMALSLVGLPAFSPIGWYLSHTAYALTNMLIPF